eukprot:8010326-Karenia_brevis.AAC.1
MRMVAQLSALLPLIMHQFGGWSIFMALDIPTHDGRNCMRTVRSCVDHSLKEEPVHEFYRWAGCQNCGHSDDLSNIYIWRWRHKFCV